MRYACRFLAVALTVALVACGSPEQREAEYLEQGLALLEAGEVDKAVVSLRNVLRINPRNARALLAMGRIHEQRDQFPQAYQAFLTAADAEPTLVEAHAAYGVLALTANQLETVADAARKIEAVDPDHPDGLALRAALALREGRLDAAEAAARQALAVDPGHVNATSALAGVFNARGDHTGAVAVLDAFFGAQGRSVPLALLKVQLLATAGDTRGVEGALQQLVEFDPSSAEARIALANYHRAEGRPEAAEAVLRTAVRDLGPASGATAALVQLVHARAGLDAAVAEIDGLRTGGSSDHDLAFLAADLLAAGQRFDDARTRLEGVIAAVGATGPRGLDAATAIAGVELAAGNVAGAEARVAGVLEVDRQHRGANYLQGVLAMRRGATADAVTAGRAALARDPNWIPGLRLVAQAHDARGERDLAIDSLERIVALDPEDLAATERLAHLLAERGDHDRALDLWDRVIERAADPTSALVRAAELAIERRDWGRASRSIDRLLAEDDSAASGAVLAGSLSLAQGDPARGREWFARAAELDPEAPQPLLGVVRSFLAQDDVAGARAVLEQRVAAVPADAVAWNVLAQLQARSDDAAAATASYQRAIEAQPAWPTPYRELAQLRLAAGDVDGALADLDAGVAAGAAPYELLLQAAFVQQSAGRYDAAIATYERLLERGATDDVVVNNFAALVADFAADDAVRMDRALALAQRFATSSVAYYLDTLGWLNFKRGDTAGALTFLRRAVALNPDDPQLRFHLGAALHASGDTSQALIHLELAARDAVAYPGSDDARALLEAVRGATTSPSTSGRAS